MKLILLLHFLFCTFFIFNQTKDIDIWNKMDWKQYKNEKFTINYPSNWSIDTSGKMETSLIFVSPYESEEDLFNDNFNLVIIKNVEKLNLSEYTNASVNRIKEVLGKFELIDSEKRTNNNQEFQYLFFKGKQSIINLVFVQHIYIVEDYCYILTFTTEQSKVDLHKMQGEKILNSFKLF